MTRAGAGVDALSGQLGSALGDRTQNLVVDLPFARTMQLPRGRRAG